MDMGQNPWHKLAPNKAEIWDISLHLVNLFSMDQIQKSAFEHVSDEVVILCQTLGVLPLIFEHL